MLEQETTPAGRAAAAQDEPLGPPMVSAQRWTQLVQQQLVQRMQHRMPGLRGGIEVPAGSAFRGRFFARRIADLEYIVMQSSGHSYRQESRDWDPAVHSVMLQRRGVSRFCSGGQEMRARPGDLLVLNDMRDLHVENEGAVDQVLLVAPLPDAARGALAACGGVHRVPPSDVAGMLFRWLDDCCRLGVGRHPGSSHALAQALRGLLAEALTALPERPAGMRLHRGAVEAFIETRLQDPALTLADVAAAFSCSLRSLHRAFRADGKESLERYIQRRRLEACAEALCLMRPGNGTITELALRYGFSSHAHFSTVFRAHFGVSPSGYRSRR